MFLLLAACEVPEPGGGLTFQLPSTVLLTHRPSVPSIDRRLVQRHSASAALEALQVELLVPNFRKGTVQRLPAVRTRVRATLEAHHGAVLVHNRSAGRERHPALLALDTLRMKSLAVELHPRLGHRLTTCRALFFGNMVGAVAVAVRVHGKRSRDGLPARVARKAGEEDHNKHSEDRRRRRRKCE